MSIRNWSELSHNLWFDEIFHIERISMNFWITRNFRYNKNANSIKMFHFSIPEFNLFMMQLEVLTSSFIIICNKVSRSSNWDSLWNWNIWNVIEYKDHPNIRKMSDKIAKIVSLRLKRHDLWKACNFWSQN